MHLLVWVWVLFGVVVVCGCGWFALITLLWLAEFCVGCLISVGCLVVFVLVFLCYVAGWLGFGV